MLERIQFLGTRLLRPLPDVTTCVHKHACFPCTEFLEGIARIQEARYNREQSEGKIIDYHRVGDSGYRVIMREAVTTRKAKVLYRQPPLLQRYPTK